jgi:hypothetical protein
MSTATKLSFHAGKFSIPCSFSMDRRLLWEDDSEEGEEVDDDMIATEGERKGRGEREENERKVGERERERGNNDEREISRL